VSTQFGHTIRSIQCNNGREFDNSSTRTFFLSHDVQLRMPCPYTFPQNGKAEHMICTTNGVMRSLLFQASFPARYWAESLYTATYILNLLPTKSISATTPYFALFGTKLAPHSCRCVFLGYSSNHKGYRCLDLTMNHLLISRHVIFGESSFPFASSDPPPDDLNSLFLSSPVICPIAPPYPSYIPGTLAPGVPATTSSPRVRPSVYHPAAVVRDPRSTHPMVTRRAAGVTKPVDRLQLSAAATPQTLSPVPTFVRSTLVDPHWRHAMEEYEALLSNSTWDLVPQPPGANVVTAKWIFKHKLKKDGSLDRCKARWVLRGFTHYPRGGLRRDLQPHRQACHRPNCVDSCCLQGLARAPARRQERLPPRHSPRPSAALSLPASLTPHTLSWCAGSTSPSTT
jgi:hypothetical protein